MTSSRVFSTEWSLAALFLGLLKGQHEIFQAADTSLVTIAPPGRGKSQCHVIPNLLSYQGPIIVLDVKGECFDASAEWRRENVGPVYRFDPDSPEKSSSYNPLAFISTDEEEIWDDAQLIADMLIVPGNSRDETWEIQGSDFLTLALAYTVTKAYALDEEPNMETVLDLVNGIDLDDMLETASDRGNPFPPAMRRTATKFKNMRETAGKQFEGVLSGATQHLRVWNSPKLNRVIQKCDWKPENFRSPPYPTLYLCISPNEIQRFSPVLRVIIGQHVRRLFKAPYERQEPAVLFMLDEMPRLGKMEPIREALETGRSYGIKLWMFAQYEGQIRDAYGTEIANGMIGACGVRIYMNPDADTAKRLSDQLGERESILDGKKVPLVTPQELNGPEWRNSMLVLADGEKPLRLEKQFAYESAT